MSRGDFWTWQSAITSSDLEPVTRHVLLTLATFMNSQNTSAFPNQETIAECTGLSKRTVINHIKKAVEAGFLEVSKHGYGGQKWANNEYVAVMPEPKKVVHLTTKGSASDDTKVVQEVHLNTQDNTPSNTQDKNFTKNEGFKLKPDKPSFDETFEKLWKEIYNLLPADKKSYASKKLTKQRILKITKRKTDPISISRIAHAVLHFYNSPGQKKDNRKFCKAPQYVIGDELFFGFLDKGPYKFGGGNDDDAFHKLWSSRAAHYAKTKRFDAQWVKGSLTNVPDHVRQYFPKEDWQDIGFVKKDLSS